MSVSPAAQYICLLTVVLCKLWCVWCALIRMATWLCTVCAHAPLPTLVLCIRYHLHKRTGFYLAAIWPTNQLSVLLVMWLSRPRPQSGRDPHPLLHCCGVCVCVHCIVQYVWVHMTATNAHACTPWHCTHAHTHIHTQHYTIQYSALSISTLYTVTFSSLYVCTYSV